MIVISSVRKLCKFKKDLEESKVDHKKFSAERRLSVFHREHLRCGVGYSGFKQKSVPDVKS